MDFCIVYFVEQTLMNALKEVTAAPSAVRTRWAPIAVSVQKDFDFHQMVFTVKVEVVLEQRMPRSKIAVKHNILINAFKPVFFMLRAKGIQ